MHNKVVAMIWYELKKFLTDKTTYYYLLMIFTIIIFGWVFALQASSEVDVSNGLMVTIFISFSIALLTLLIIFNQSLNDELERGGIFYALLAIPKRPVYFLGKLLSQLVCLIVFYEVIFLLIMLAFSLVDNIHIKLLFSIFLLIPLVLFYLLLVWFLYYICKLRKGTAILAFIIYVIHLFFSLKAENTFWSDIYNIFNFLKTIFAFSLSQTALFERMMTPYLTLIFICLILISLLLPRLKKMDF